MVYTWIATAAFGLEGVVGNELRRLGIQGVSVEQGGARFKATFKEAFHASIWLRSADRVLLLLAEGEVHTFEELFQLVKNVAWENFISKEGRIPVTGKCTRSQLMSVRDCQSITKKAIVERMKKALNTSFFPETRESYAVDISIHSNKARLTLDASGEALNKRGYRTQNGDAAIRETLAAAMIQLSPWRVGMPLYDPCCGTGTLLIEAAMIATNRAPGLMRHHSMEDWTFNKENLHSIRKEAELAFESNRDLHISGSDIDSKALKLCKRHIVQAGLSNRILVHQEALESIQLPNERGVFIINPPYGERLSDRKSCEKLYCAIGRLAQRHPHYALCIISNHPSMERFIGRRATKKRRLYNGRLECEFLIFD